MTTRHAVKIASVQASALTPAEIQTVIGAATQAPSIHNTQPWFFDVRGSVVDVYADFDRALRWSVDPQARQLVISCGAALFNLRVAAAHLARTAEVRLLPARDHPDLLASVAFGERGRSNDPEAELFPSVRRRHTHRRPFAARTIPGAVLGELTEGVRAEHAFIVPIGLAQRDWLFDLATFSEVVLADRPGYEADLIKWTGGSSSRRDGIPTVAFGTLSETGAPPMRDFSLGRAYIREREHYPHDPWIAILSTANDDAAAWLHAGQALQRLLLTATSRGLAASFLNQPLDDTDIRRDLTSKALGGYPQMILRLGYATRETPTPRRAIVDIARITR